MANSFLNRSDLPLGLRNNNPGDIRATGDQWQGMVGSESGFVTFQDVSYGIRAMGKILENYIAAGYNTITAIISRYAPSTENNTQAYINNVSYSTGWSADQELMADGNTLFQLIRAMIRQEIGSYASLITDDDISQGLGMLDGSLLTTTNVSIGVEIIVVAGIIIYFLTK